MEQLLNHLLEKQLIQQDAVDYFKQQHTLELMRIQAPPQTAPQPQQPQTPPGLVPTYQDRPLFEVKNFDRVDKFDGNVDKYKNWIFDVSVAIGLTCSVGARIVKEMVKTRDIPKATADSGQGAELYAWIKRKFEGVDMVVDTDLG